MTDMSEVKALAPIERAQVALGSSETEKTLNALIESSREITSITNADGHKQCHAQRVVLKKTRIEIEKTGKSARDDAIAFSKAVIGEERRLIGIIEPEETRLQGLQDAWEAQIAAEKAEKERIEQERKAGIKALIDTNFSMVPVSLLSAGSAGVLEALRTMQDTAIGDEYQEMGFEAENAKLIAVSQLNTMYSAAVAREVAEAERIAQAEAARIKAEKDAADARAEAKRQADAAKLERERAEAERIAQAEAARKQAEQEAAVARAEAKRQADAAKLEREQREAAEAIKKEADRIAAEALREEMRQQQIELDRQREVLRLESERIEAERIALQPPVVIEQPPVMVEKSNAVVSTPDEDAEFDALLAGAETIDTVAQPDYLEIIRVLADHYDVEAITVIAWLHTTDWGQV